MDYSFTDEQGIKRTMSLNRDECLEAVRNDYEELIRKYNPDVVKFRRLRTAAGEALKLEVKVNALSHYLSGSEDSEPKLCDSMKAIIVVKMGYPVVSVSASYDPDYYLASPNVFTSGNACIDGWVPFKSSLITVVDKLVRDMIHDPEVTRYDSMANHEMENWHKKGVREGRFPTIEPRTLYMREKKCLPPRTAARRAPALPPRVH